MIDRFAGEHRFLSNFYDSQVFYDGYWYPTLEHAFQASKTLNHTDRERIINAPTPRDAKKIGREVTLREDWEFVKVNIMGSLLQAKFSEPWLAKKLLETQNKELVEGNSWHDQIWGNCTCGEARCKEPGENHLGKLLMQVRSVIYDFAMEVVNA